MSVTRFPTERTRQTVGSALRRFDTAARGNWSDRNREAFVRAAQEAAAVEAARKQR